MKTSVMVLTGGDATDGWVAPGASLLAYNLDNPAALNETIQGVTFLKWDFPAATAPTPPAGITVTAENCAPLQARLGFPQIGVSGGAAYHARVPVARSTACSPPGAGL